MNLALRFLRHGGIYRSDGLPNRFEPGVATPPPVGRRPCPGRDRDGRNATCSSASSAMSSGRLFLDRVARQHCPSPLHRQSHPKTVPGWGTIRWQQTGNSVLTVCLSRGDNRSSVESVSHSVPYLEAYSPDSNADKRHKRRVALMVFASLVVALCLQFVAYFLLDAIPLKSAISAGVRSIAVVFCCACLPAYAVWVDLLHRKPSGVTPIAVALCLLWCVAGLFFPAIRF